MLASDTATKLMFNEALEKAKMQSEPFFKETLRIAQDELSRALGTYTADYESTRNRLENRITEINEDLTIGGERLTLNEQKELSRRQRDYEIQLMDLNEQAAATGLTFSSMRGEQQERLQTAQTDIIESTQLQYLRNRQDLQRQTSRTLTDLQKQADDIRRSLEEAQKGSVRGFESQFGTSNLPANVPRGTELGGISGTFTDQQKQDIAQRAQILYGLGSNYI